MGRKRHKPEEIVVKLRQVVMLDRRLSAAAELRAFLRRR